jgi:hypothetical protein
MAVPDEGLSMSFWRPYEPEQVVLTKKVTTDAKGEARLEVGALTDEEIKQARDRQIWGYQYRVEARVVDKSRREVREASRVSFSRRERVKAEGVSRDLAERIVAAFRSANLPLHAFDPIRRNVIRGGREWVPAILRYNRIPARVLLEVCNLNNPDDRKLLVTPAYRDRVARALVSALVAFYGGAPAANGSSVTAQKMSP